MLRISKIGAGFVLFACHLSLAAQEFRTQKITPDVYVVAGEYGTNIGVVNNRGKLVLIDPMPDSHNLVELEKRVHQLFPQAVDNILNTHDHSDHTGGNEYFVKKGAKLSTSLAIGDIQTLIVKAHSSQDRVYLHKPSKTLFVGDIIDSSWHPTFYAGGQKGFNQALERILALSDASSVIVPGHGDSMNRDQVQQFQRNTNRWIKAIARAKNKGLSIAEMMVEKDVKEALDAFNLKGKKAFIPAKAFKRFIERTTRVLEQEK